MKPKKQTEPKEAKPETEKGGIPIAEDIQIL
jgi:hypothetical protein